MTILKFAFATALVASVNLAYALEVQPYSASALASAQKADKPVALHFHADWCSTCKAQDAALKELKKEQGLDVVVLQANYDTEKELKRQYGVRSQSTLVVLHGNKEVSRLVGDTSTVGIRGALKAAL